MRSLFITGTDTDAGKTYVTAGIVSSFHRDGLEVMPVKPVQTGCVNDFFEDIDFVLGTAGISASRDEKAKLCPYRFSEPCSPHLAAEIAGGNINLEELKRKLLSLEKNHQTVIAEGSGGVLVPLGDGVTMLDLMKELAWPVLLVSCDRLGTINHTLMSLRTLESAGIEIAGVVINHCQPPSDLFSASNRNTIGEYGRVKILGEIPYSPDEFPHYAFTGICNRLRGILQP